MMDKYIVKVGLCGVMERTLDGQYHREDGPAIEFIDGASLWYFKGSPHRADGPASIWEDGSRYWYINGGLHREDGPAIERIDHPEEWYLNGVSLTKEEFEKKRFDG